MKKNQSNIDFPGQGVVVFGQKTLQSKPSAPDRINVRRLLINFESLLHQHQDS